MHSAHSCPGPISKTKQVLSRPQPAGFVGAHAGAQRERSSVGVASKETHGPEGQSDASAHTGKQRPSGRAASSERLKQMVPARQSESPSQEPPGSTVPSAKQRFSPASDT